MRSKVPWDFLGIWCTIAFAQFSLILNCVANLRVVLLASKNPAFFCASHAIKHEKRTMTPRWPTLTTAMKRLVDVHIRLQSVWIVRFSHVFFTQFSRATHSRAGGWFSSVLTNTRGRETFTLTHALNLSSFAATLLDRVFRHSLSILLLCLLRPPSILFFSGTARWGRFKEEKYF